MRNIVASLLCVFAILVNGPADAQCAGGSCGASVGYGYGYTFRRSLGAVYAPYSYSHPASSYAAYAVPYAVRSGTLAVPVFSQYGGSGHVYTTAGDPAALTAWIRVNDPARAVVPVVPPSDSACSCRDCAGSRNCYERCRGAKWPGGDCFCPGTVASRRKAVDSAAALVQPSPVPSTLPTPLSPPSLPCPASEDNRVCGTITTHPTLSPPSSLSPPSPPLGSQDPVGNAFVAWLNGHRAARGLGPVVWDDSLVYSCSVNNSEQIRRGLGHWVMRCRRQNAGMGSYQQVVTMWIASPPHAAALFDASITRVAIVGDGAYWTFDAN